MKHRGSVRGRADAGTGLGPGVERVITMKQFNEDVRDETMADITLSAMIDEGDDCDGFDREKNESEFI